jgi:hypothetical protein
MNDPRPPRPETALLDKIRAKRAEIDTFLRTMEPRSERLTNITIVCGAISAALTAAPALGGRSLTDWLTEIFGLTLPVWQLLCFGAMICSIAVTISTNLSRSQEITSKIMKAQACDAKLEGLETLIEVGRVDVDSASNQFVNALTHITFI